MDTDPLPDDVFDRLTILERAQFLYDSAQRRHSEALDRQQRDRDRHAALHQEHLTRMAHLEALMDRQQDLQAQMLAVQDRLVTRQDDQTARLDDHAARMARLEEISAKVQLTLDAVLAMLRHRNGH